MAVNSLHPEYTKRIRQWSRCRAVAEGEDAVKNAGTEYLPALSGQSPGKYDAYVKRALFYGATGRTIQGLNGAIFRKESVLELPSNFDDLINIFTSDGLSLESFSHKIINEVITAGRVGVLVDPPRTESTRAFASIYTAESIINWKTTVIDGVRTTSMIVLKEPYATDGDMFEHNSEEQYRVLLIDKGVYIQLIYRKAKNKTDFVVAETIKPTRAGMPLTEIPFYFINGTSVLPDTEKPPLLDLVDVNLSHYRTSADLEHGAHFTALPTAVVAGFPTDEVFEIGSGIAWSTENPNAKAFFLEYQGQGLGALVDLKASKESLMAILGARMLEEPKRAAESFDTHRIRHSADNAALSTLANQASIGIERILKKMVWWSNASDQIVDSINFELNRDFLDEKLTPTELTSLFQVYQGGGISLDTFLNNLKRGEIIPAGTTVEDEKDALNIRNIDDGSYADVIPLNRQYEVIRNDDGQVVGIKGS